MRKIPDGDIPFEYDDIPLIPFNDDDLDFEEDPNWDIPDLDRN